MDGRLRPPTLHTCAVNEELGITLPLFSALGDQSRKGGGVGDFEVNGPELERIHRVNNYQKFHCYFTGFLEGISASGRIERGEVEPLIAQCLDFLRGQGDPDAGDIIQDIECDLLEYEAIRDVAIHRSRGVDAKCLKSATNRLLGFCAGVACDNLITLREAQSLLNRIESDRRFEQSPGVRAIRDCCRDALEDCVVDETESREICSWISRVAGDSFSDTGLSAVFRSIAFDEHVLEDFPRAQAGKNAVLTGNFRIKPRNGLERRLTEIGMVITKQVSRNTDYLIIGGEATRDWVETNRGMKILRAQELIESGAGPKFVSEGQVLRLLGM